MLEQKRLFFNTVGIVTDNQNPAGICNKTRNTLENELRKIIAYFFFTEPDMFILRKLF